MVKVLEQLCRRFARDREIALNEDQAGLIYGRKNGLEIKLVQASSNFSILDIQKVGESSVTLIYSGHCDERLAEIEIDSWCFLDYLTLLRNTHHGFAQAARTRFEIYLGSVDIDKYVEEFTEANAIDIFWVLNSFYPPRK